VSYSIVAGDFNGDGIPDLAVTNQYSDDVTVLIGDGTGNFDPAAITPHAYYAQSAVKGDFNGDGVSDLAVISNVSYVTILEAATETATATVSTTPPPPGTAYVEASYPGDSNYGASAAMITSPNGVLVAPTVTVTPSSSSITAAQTLTVAVAVSGPSVNPTATGSVTLTSGSYTSAATTLSSGNAQINIPAGSLKVGSDTLTVTYTPDASSSAVFAKAIGASSVAVTPPTLIAPTVTVTPASSSIAATQTLTVAVTVSGPSGSPTATGSVTLTGGGYTSSTTTLSSGRASITIPAGALSLGADTLTVNYTPDSASSVFYTGSSGTSTVTVTKITLITPTVTVMPLSTSILTSQALQVDVSVSGPSGDPTPTGSVDLSSGSYDSGAIILSGGSATINIPAGSLSAGNDTLTASYAPDSASSATYSSATGSSSVTVTAGNPSLAVSSMSPAVQSAGNAGFTITINGSGFTSGSVIYWGTSALTTQFVSAAQISASVPASDIASPGTDAVSVQNPSPGGGTSDTLQFEVDSAGAESPSFAQNTATVTAGQSATYSVTLSSAANAVTVNCLNLPGGATCSYSSAANTVTIATSSTTPTGTYQATVVFTETVAGAASSFIFLPILVAPLLLFRRKSAAGKIWFTACLGLLLLVASAGIGCGRGSSGGGTGQTHQVTTSGVVTLKVH
jgi:hypothetical protein